MGSVKRVRFGTLTVNKQLGFATHTRIDILKWLLCYLEVQTRQTIEAGV